MSGFPTVWKILFQNDGATRKIKRELISIATDTDSGSVKLSDSASTSGISSGVAATPKAVKDTIDGSAIKFSVVQELTNAQKKQARSNIDAASASSVSTEFTSVRNDLANTVHFDAAQELTDAQKLQARANINAVDTTTVTALSNTVAQLNPNLVVVNGKLCIQYNVED